VAFTCPDHPSLAAGNQLREVVLGLSAESNAAYDQVESYYASRGLRCTRWTPAADQPPEPLGTLLTPRGFSEHRTRAMLLTRWVKMTPLSSVRIVPARAMRRALDAVFADGGNDPNTEPAVYVAATHERIDDPALDLFVALLDGEPVGVMDLLQVGEIGCVKTAFTHASVRGRGVGTALLAHVLQLAQRLALRHICVEVEATDEPVEAFFQRAGFEVGGELVAFARTKPT
jgi:GNAT superfamily N-acetyltransferase